MAFELAPLPFAPDALGEFMSRETLDFHHGKHHQAYVDKVNDLLGNRDEAGGSLVEVVRRAHVQGDTTLFNHSAQIWNHNSSGNASLRRAAGRRAAVWRR